MTDSIIAYRNPLEAAMWEGAWASGPIVFPIMCAMAAAVITIVILANIGDKFFSRNNFYRKYGLEMMCGLAAIVAIFVYNWMT